MRAFIRKQSAGLNEAASKGGIKLMMPASGELGDSNMCHRGWFRWASRDAHLVAALSLQACRVMGARGQALHLLLRRLCIGITAPPPPPPRACPQGSGALHILLK